MPTLAGFAVFASIRRPLTLGFTAAVSDPVVLRRGGIRRQRLAFGVLRVVLHKNTKGQKKKENLIFYPFPDLLYFSCLSSIQQRKHCKPSAYLSTRSPLFTASSKNCGCNFLVQLMLCLKAGTWQA